MTPDDPRHGTYAGYVAHTKQGVPTCPPCQLAARRYRKTSQMRLNRGTKNRVPLGPEAHKILTESGATHIANQTGLHRNNLYRIQRLGPNGQTLRTTRDAILATKPITPIGIQRRLQALVALGHTAHDIAEHAGCHPEPLTRIIRRKTPPTVVKQHITKGVLHAYQMLSMTKPPASRYRTRRLNTARAAGYVTSLAWDDIDNDPQPQGSYIEPNKHDRRLYTIQHHAEQHADPETTAAHLGITKEALWKWCVHHGHRDLYHQLAAHRKDAA